MPRLLGPARLGVSARDCAEDARARCSCRSSLRQRNAGTRPGDFSVRSVIVVFVVFVVFVLFEQLLGLVDVLLGPPIVGNAQLVGERLDIFEGQVEFVRHIHVRLGHGVRVPRGPAARPTSGIERCATVLERCASPIPLRAVGRRAAWKLM